MTQHVQSPDIDALNLKIGLKLLRIECLGSMLTNGEGTHKSLGYRLAFSDSSTLTLSLEDVEYEEGGEVYVIRTSDRFADRSNWTRVEGIPEEVFGNPIIYWEVLTGCSQLFDEAGNPISVMYVVEEGIRLHFKGNKKLEFHPGSESPGEALTMRWFSRL